MSSRKSFIKRLLIEITQWASVGIIDEEQKERILKLYQPHTAHERKNLNKRLPAIIIGLAAVLLCSGIILFYAANWKKMPPTVKLIQVFILIAGAYSASYFLLAARKANVLIGRVLLMTGMVSYGAGIVLVAQIYHISANPAGVLAWALGVLAMSFVMKEKWGYYLAAALFFVWNVWELTVYSNPNYVFIIFPFALFYLFYKSRAITGVALALFGFIFWYYQINISWIVSVETYKLRNIPTAIFALSHLPLGVILVGLGWMGEKDKTLNIPAKITAAAGWIFIAAPFLYLSWPVTVEPLYLSFHTAGIFQSIGFIVLLIIAGFVIFLLNKRRYNFLLPAFCAMYSAVLFALPLGHNPTLMVSTHIGLLAFLFGMLYFYSAGAPDRKIEKFLSFFLFILFLTVKCIGLLVLGLGERHYFIVYCTGGLLYIIVSLLINQSVRILSAKKGISFPANIINSACAIAGYGMVYALSFRVREQFSVFNTEPVVIAMIILFFIIALFLYLFLWLKSDQKLMITLSAVIFILSVIVLIITGPKISWIVYSIIFNIMLFIMSGTFIYYSIRINSKLFLNFAIAGFIIHVVTRYFDIFWDLLSGSLLFIITGILGIAGGWILLKVRKKLISQIEQAGNVE